MTTTGTTGTTDNRESGVLGNGDLLVGGGQWTDDAGAVLGGADDGAEAREELAPGAGPLDVVGGPAGHLALVELGVRHVEVEGAYLGVDGPGRRRDARERPPTAASGVTWIAASTLPEAPDMRPSVSRATRWPRSCSTPAPG